MLQHRGHLVAFARRQPVCYATAVQEDASHAGGLLRQAAARE
jgi:hypothetical protein